jgi:hypothetical protein
MVLLRVLENRFQADVWCQALKSEGIEYLLRTYEDTAYDGLFVSQKGYASLYVEESRLKRAREVDAGLWSQTAGQIPSPQEPAQSFTGREDLSKAQKPSEDGAGRPGAGQGYAIGRGAEKK